MFYSMTGCHHDMLPYCVLDPTLDLILGDMPVGARVSLPVLRISSNLLLAACLPSALHHVDEGWALQHGCAGQCISTETPGGLHLSAWLV